MSTTELLEQLRAARVTLRVVDGRLSVSAPRGSLTAELRAALAASKAELVTLLSDAEQAEAADTAPLPRAPRTATLPLSHAQQRIWFLETLEGGSTVYNIPWAVRIRGGLEPMLLERAVHALLRRHESLRSTVDTTSEGPRQRIHEAVELQIDRVSLPAADPDEIHRQVSAWATTRFDLRVGPLLKVGLIEVGRNDWVLALVFHHLVIDGWSLNIVQRELMALYTGYLTGQPASLPALPLQAADHAVWQRAELESGAFAGQLAFWQRELKGAPPLLALPTDQPRPAEQSYRGARVRQALGSDLSRTLVDFTAEREVTLFTVLLAAFKVLLARYSGQTDIVVGTPVAGRGRTELEGVVGLLLNTLALRSDLHADPNFGDLVAGLQAHCLDAFAHQDIPFDRVVEALDLPRNLAHTPVFQAQFILQNAPAGNLSDTGLDIEPVDFDYGTAKFDLTLAIAEGPHGLAAEFEYCSDLFAATTIEQMLGSFVALLRAAVAQPALPISRLPLLSADERSTVLGRLQGRTATCPPDITVDQAIARQAQRTPNAIALIAGDTELTYATLNARANQLAHWLHGRSTDRGARVGVYLERSSDLVVSLLGILKAGAAYVPLDTDYPLRRLQHMLTDAEVDTVLTSAALAPRLDGVSATVISLESEQAALRRHPESEPQSGSRPDDLAYVIFTSGSTGRPKGVMNTHRGVCNRLLWMQDEYRLNAGDRVLQKTPYSFDVSVWELFWPLLAGSTLVVARPDGHRDTAYLCSVIRNHRITTLHFVPTLLQLFLQDADPTACATLQRVFSSGEALTQELQTRFFLTLDAELHNLYGPTEAAIDVCYWHCPRDSRDPVVPIGYPVANTVIYLVEPNGEPAPPGMPGELWIGGVQVAAGYAGRPDLTAERFIPDPFAADPGARVYRTGDRARQRADGSLEFLGRIDQQVKLRGLRIEPGEIEAALAALPGIGQSVVVLREDDPARPQLVAYLSPRAGCEPAVAELRTQLARTLPDYMVPGSFVMLDTLPLLPNGKVDRARLPAPTDEGASGTAFRAPASATEQTLAAIWSRLLGREHVGVDDNFFELGGDSILSIQIVAQAAQAGIRLEPKQVFRQQTIAELAAVAGSEPMAAAEQGLVSGPVALTPIQTWFFTLDDTAPQHFNQSIRLRFRQPLSATTVADALQAVYRHHDALRLQFTRTGAGWTQRFGPPATGSLVTRLAVDSATKDHEPAITAAAAELQSAFDLAKGPLLRALLVCVDDEPLELIIAAHHLVMDGLSWRILLEDLATACAQLDAGGAVTLPAKTASYRDWSASLAEYARSTELRREASYWRDQPWQRCAALPVDTPGGDNRAGAAATVALQLSAPLTTRLLTQSPAAFSTRINELLLAGFARAWRIWCGQDTVLLDLESHGRDGPCHALDISRSVGWFTALYPAMLRTDFPDCGALVMHTKEHLRALPRDGAGYGVLRYLTDIDLDPVPEPQVLFNYLGQFDASFAQAGWFELSSGSRGDEQSPDRQRSHLLELNGGIYDGRLQFNLTYSPALHSAESMQRLADAYRDSLETLIEYCADPAHGSLTPSDFPLAGVDAPELKRLLQNHPDPEDIYPATPLQQGMIFHSQLTEVPTAAAYITQVVWTLDGPLDAGALERAWQTAAARHETLRTGFADTITGRPLAIVHRAVQLHLELTDWRALPEEAQHRALEAALAADREQGFEISAAPLMRLRLFRCTADRHQFVWSHHHVLLDGWSIPVVLNEVFAVYRALVRQTSPELPPVRRYRDYVEWLVQQDAAAAAAHWQATLGNFSTPTPLPGAQRAEPGAAPACARSFSTLSTAATERLRAQARDQRITLNTLAQGAWALLLSRCTGASDVLFGATSSGRPAELAHVEQMVGLFLSALPCRINVSPEEPAGPWLTDIQNAQLATRQHEHVGLAEIQRCSGVKRGVDLFQTLLVFENYPDTDALVADRAGLRVAGMDARGWTNFPLSIAVSVGSQLVARISYDTRLFSAARIEQLGSWFTALLETLAAQPLQRIGSLLEEVTAPDAPPGLPAGELTGRAPKPLTEAALVDLFERRVAERPDAKAVISRVSDSDTTDWSYAQLNNRANGIARALLALDLPGNSRIALLLNHDALMIAGVLGTLKAGHAYVPVDPQAPPARQQQIAKAADVAAILHARELADAAARLGPVTLEADAAAEQPQTANLPRRAAPDELAYILTTSGSTGQPKGVTQTQRNVAHHALHYAEALELRATDRLSLVSAYGFDAAVTDMFAALLTGATVCPVAARGTGSTQLGCALAALGVTVFHATPTLYRFVFGAADLPRLPQLRAVVLGGEEARPDDLLLFKQRCAPGCRFVNGYGLTESTLALQYFADHATPVPATALPIGRPVAGTGITLLNEQGQPAALAGEIAISSPWVATGYWNDADTTTPAFSAARDGRQVFRTGDLARYDADGNLVFSGRRDDQLNIRGHRVEPGEIEQTLRGLEGVAQAAVVGWPQGAPETSLIAYVETVPAASWTPATLRTALATKLPSYMLPANCMVLDQLPLTASGKLDRRQLPEPASQPAQAEYVAPRTELETGIAGIWSAVLQVDRVGVHDNFFELGGHSLKAVQLIARLREALDIEISLQALFDQPTIAGLLGELRPAKPSALITAAPRPPGQTLPLSFAQQRLWFVDQLEPGSSLYVLSWAQRVPAGLDLGALQQAVDALVARHESLRTAFVAGPEGPQQVIHPHAALTIQREHLKPASKADLGNFLAERVHQPFELTRAPLLRVKVFASDNDSAVLAFAIHHIIADNWSVQILMRDLLALYRQASGEPAAQLPALPVQYVDYALWQHGRLGATELERQKTYWLGQLHNVPPTLELPTDRPRPSTLSHRGDQVHWQLTDATAARLRAIGAAAGCSPFMVFVAVYAMLLARYARTEDLVIGTPVAGRPQSALEHVIGLFVNMLPLRADLSGNPLFGELLERVRRTTLDAFAHQDLPFEQLIEALQPARDRSRSPVFQAAFILHNAPTPGTDALVDAAGQLGEPVQVAHANSKFDLTLGMWETQHALGGSFEFCSEVFERPTIERLRDHFCELLQAVAACPEARIGELDMRPPAERRQHREWNATHRERSSAGLQACFEAQAAAKPRQPAVTCRSQTLTYAELNRRANRLAHLLLEAGTAPETPIALCLERGIEAVVSILAIAKAGGAYVPLDPAYPAERLRFMLADSASRLLLTRSDLDLSQADTNCRRIDLDQLETQLQRQSDQNPAVSAGGEQLAYIVYTSGSTGQPKGVMVEQHSVVARMTSDDFAPLRQGLRIGMLAPLAFDASTLETWGALLNGGECVVYPEPVPEIAGLRNYLNNHPLDLLFLTTGLFNTLVDADPGMLSAVQQILTGGEAMSLQHIRRAGKHLPGTRLSNIYGPTETTTFATVYALPDHLLTGSAEHTPDAARVPIGRPLANTTLHILDLHGQPAAVGTPGELYIGGAGLARGYLGQPALTAKMFVEHPHVPGLRLYRTGDIARYRADGNVEFLGRADAQVKLRGFRIEPGEIESALREHPGVRDARVTVTQRSAIDRRLVGYVVPLDLSPGLPDDVDSFIAAKLPDYMRPAALVALPAIPLTPNGKLDTSRLPAPEWAATRDHTPAQTPLQERLCELWRALLDVPEIGIHDDFFELGGHSLLIIRLLDDVEREFGQRLTVAEVFAEPTVATIARRLAHPPAESKGTPSGTLLPVRTAGNRPPLFCIHGEPQRMARALNAEQPLYGVYFSYDPKFRMPDSLEELAALYVRELRKVQPRGPYHLVGYCLGGLAAYEMARQLNDSGEAIAYLALIDPTNPELSFSRREWLRRAFSVPGQRLQALRFFSKRAMQSAVSRSQYVARIALTYGYEWLGKEIPFLLREYRHTGKARTSFNTYRYRQLPLAGTVFEPELSAEDAARLQRYWDSKFTRGANLVTVPGLLQHPQFMQEPFHTTVSEAIDRQLDALAQNHGDTS